MVRLQRISFPPPLFEESAFVIQRVVLIHGERKYSRGLMDLYLLWWPLNKTSS